MTTQDNYTKANLQIAKARIPTTVKNLSIGLLNQPGEVTFRNLSGFTTMSGSIITASGIALQMSNMVSSSTDLPNGSRLTNTSTLYNILGERVFAIPQISYYEGSISAANKIPCGENIATTDYDYYVWLDWGSSDDYNQVIKSTIVNKTGSTQTILYRCNWRYIVTSSTA